MEAPMKVEKALLNSTGEDEAPVIVGMFADEVDTTWRSIYVTCLAIEMLHESASYKFYIHMILKFNSYKMK